MTADLAKAEHEFRRLADRYADAINRADFTDLAACWAIQGVWTVASPFSYNEVGRDDIVALVAKRRTTTEFVVMSVGAQVLTSATATRLRGRTTIEEQGRRRDGSAIHVLGCYEDELELDDGGAWVFARRTLTVLASDTAPTTLAPPSES